NKNHYAANLSFGIALTLGLCLAFLSGQPYRRWSLRFPVLVERLTGVLLNPGYLRFGLLLVLLTAFFFAQSRGAFLALAAAAGALLLLGAYWRDYRTRSRHSSTLPSAEIRVLPWLLVTAALAAVWLSSSGLFARLLPSELSDAGRMVTWIQTLEMWRDHWLFGVGNGSFQYVFTAYKVAALDGNLYDFAHSDHLQLLAEQGVIGAVLFYAFFLACFWRMLSVYCRSGGNRSRQGLLLGIIIAVAAFFLHGLVDFNFHIPSNALWFYTLLALGLVTARRIVQDA
ncbi:MAG: O-antigen ligase family protein, partial [Halioglobus sp.]|nr:O-antigen ligase family protein [Halioglobus sp.]